jgi:glucose-6-phosphate 1-dehydrogenase
MRGDEVEAAWAWTDPVIAAWQASGAPPLAYAPGTSGPDAAMDLMRRDGRGWREIRP